MTNQIDSQFLHMPAEIRNRIYALALDVRGGIYHYDHLDWDRLELPRTCRQIFMETACDYFDSKIAPLCSEGGASLPSDIEMMEAILSKFTRPQKTIINRVYVCSIRLSIRSKSAICPFIELPNLEVLMLERWAMLADVFGLGLSESFQVAWRRWTQNEVLCLRVSHTRGEPLRLD